MAVETETDGVDPMRARLVGISAAVRAGEGFYLPVGHDYMGAPEQLDLEVVREILGPVLADPKIRKVGQNFKYDLHVLRRHGLPVEGWELDTMVAAFLLEPDRPTFNLDSLGVSQYRLAVDIEVPPRRINEIVRGLRGVSADTALRLARYFRTTPQFWMNLQVRFDLEMEEERVGPRIRRIKVRRPGVTS